VIEFSSLKHLKEMQKRQVRKLKIRQLLLLLLRMLIILVAVLAFARPASKGGYIGSHAGVSSVILLDKSASMQRQVKDGILFDIAKSKTEDILENFGESDELILIPFDRDTYFPAGQRFFSRDIAENILEETEAGFNRSNYETAINKAIQLLNNAKNLNKELYIITDRQVNSLPEKIDSIKDDITVYFTELPLETDGNNSVVDIDLGGQLISLENPFGVMARIKNHDSFSKGELLASLFFDGVRVMQSEFALDEKGEATVQFTHTISRPGFHHGWVEISDDGFLPDNRFYFSFKIPERFNILVVDGDNSGDLLRLALVPNEDLTRYWSVKTTDPSGLPGLKLREYDAIVLSGVTSLGSAESSRLMEFVDNGGGLFYILGGNTDLKYFNNTFGSLLDVNLIKNIPSDFTGAGYYTLERFDYTHPIFKAFERFKTDSLPTLRFYALPAYESGDNNRKIAYFSNRLPAFIESAFGLGKVITLMAPINPRYTDLPAHSFFVPMTIRIMEYLANSISEYQEETYVGQNIIRSLSGSETNYGTVTMITPEDQRFEISGVEKTGRIIYDCRPIKSPGIYRLVKNERLLDLFPVNLPSSESDLSRADFDRLAEILDIDNAKIIPYNQSSVQMISEARFGRELWQLFLWVVVVLMAVEMFFSRAGDTELEEK